MSLFLLHVLGYFDFFIGIFFTINSDFDRPERKGHGAKVPGSEMARERKGQGASWPGSESARVLLADSLRGANWPGNEARYRVGMKHGTERNAGTVCDWTAGQSGRL